MPPAPPSSISVTCLKTADLLRRKELRSRSAWLERPAVTLDAEHVALFAPR